MQGEEPPGEILRGRQEGACRQPRAELKENELEDVGDHARSLAAA